LKNRKVFIMPIDRRQKFSADSQMTLKLLRDTDNSLELASKISKHSEVK
jgi:hypothetical protein